MKDLLLPTTPRLAVSVQGSGPLVILVHGMGGNRSNWAPQIEALSPYFTAVAVDLRGYGESEDPPHPLDFKTDFSSDLVAVMDHFQVPRAHLVGLSMGGRVVRATCLRHPERVASAVLANTSPGFDHLTTEQQEAFVKQRSGALVNGTFPPGFGEQQARAMLAPLAPPAAFQSVAHASDRLRLRNYLEVLRVSTLQDRGDRLESIRCPVHLITSDLDQVYPEAIAHAMQARIPQATLSRIVGAGHISNLEQPATFNRILLDFLRALPQETSARI